MNWISRIILSTLFVFALSSCEELFEDDISNQKVIIFSPSNNLQTQNTKITFWWDSIPGASNYNIQVVSKTFINIEDVILDSTLTKTKVVKTLPVGKYQCKVIAFNSNSKAYSDTCSFEIIVPLTK